MKLSISFYIVLTTMILVTVAIMSAINMPFNWVYFATLVGQASLLLMVYKVLTDDYDTDKTFDDWYEDHPIDQE